MKKEKTETSTKKSKNERIEQFLKEHYAFRYNTVKSRTEFRPQGENIPFAPLTKYDINSMRRLVDGSLGIYTPSDNIRTILESDFCSKVNPIHEFLLSLPKPKGEDESEIIKLANCVSVKNPDKWQHYFVKWLVAVVANAMDDLNVEITPVWYLLEIKESSKQHSLIYYVLRN